MCFFPKIRSGIDSYPHIKICCFQSFYKASFGYLLLVKRPQSKSRPTHFLLFFRLGCVCGFVACFLGGSTWKWIDRLDLVLATIARVVCDLDVRTAGIREGAARVVLREGTPRDVHCILAVVRDAVTLLALLTERVADREGVRRDEEHGIVVRVLSIHM